MQAANQPDVPMEDVTVRVVDADENEQIDDESLPLAELSPAATHVDPQAATEDDLIPPIPFHVQLIPNLVYPSALLAFNFALLKLVDFPGQPHVPVCINCGTLYKMTTPKRIPVHYIECLKAGERRDITNPTSTTNEDVDDELSRDGEDIEMHETGADDRIDDDDRASDNEHNHLDPEDIQPQEEDYVDTTTVTEVPTKDSPDEIFRAYRRQKYAKLSKYILNNPFDNITTYPLHPIPPIPFAIDKTTYICPIPNCSIRFADKAKAKTHIGKHSTADNEDDGYLQPNPHPAQQLFTRHNSPRFLVLAQEVDIQTVSSSTDKIRQQLQPTIQSSTRLIDGPQQLNIYMKRMGLYRAFPADRSTYNQFVSHRIMKVSMIHHPRQPLRFQLLTVAIFVYLMGGREALRSQDHLIARHIGNKLRQVFRLTCEQPLLICRM